MAPEALREDAGLLYRGRPLEVGDNDERTDREPPGPPRAARVVLWLARDLDDAEDRLPDRGVEDRELAGLERGPLRRGVSGDLPRPHVTIERSVAAAADEQPAGQTRSMTAAMAWPWPMHIVARP